jgi:CCR4-NOT transcriptional complex subunit CAF120
MMTGGGMNPMMGYGMMPGFNPQHLFAAQQAAQAYQNAMMAFSVAGSQVGGDGGNGGGANPQQAMNPMMTGNMAGFDPRMSMNLMGMGMMGGMGMSPQMMNPTPLGAQTTGMSQFNAQAGGVADQGQLGLSPGNQNLSAPNSQFNSGNNSPVGRGSSPLRQSETPQRSRPTSPGV